MKILFLNIWAEIPLGTRHLNHREHEIWHVCDPKNGVRYIRHYVAENEVRGITIPQSEDPRELLMLLQSVYAEFPFERVVALRRKLAGPDHPSLATAINNLASLKVTLQQPEQAEPLAALRETPY